MVFISEASDLKGRGFGGRAGFGGKPALVVVDFSNAFTDPRHRLGADVSSEINLSNSLIEAFRKVGAPIVFTVIEYETRELAAASNWRRKIDAITDLYKGSDASRLDSRLCADPHDIVIAKQYASAFFGTELNSYFAGVGIDTVVVAGCSTSGCVRATVVDACQYGYSVIVAKEAVADRDESAHKQALIDIEMKYGDVISTHEILSSLS